VCILYGEKFRERGKEGEGREGDGETTGI